jgi:biopolymer transport protein ExbB
MDALLVIWKNTPFVAFLLYLVATISLAIFLERFSNVKRSKVLPKYWQRIKRAIVEGRLEEAITYLQRDKRLISKLLLNHLRLYQAKEIDKGELLNLFEKESEIIYAALSRGVSFLAIAVTLSTLLGLIGTVIGLIDVFQTFGVGGGSEAIRLLSKGISTSLNSTAAGLIVAIFTYFLYWIIKERINSVYTKVVAEVLEVLERLR